MDLPVAQFPQGFDILDFKSLARVTSKTFERLAPFTQLQNPSSPDVQAAARWIIKKIETYLEAIDTSIQVVQTAYEMSKTAAIIWGMNPKDKKSRLEHQQHLEALVTLAGDAHEKAVSTNTLFKQVQQDFYRLAALSKDIDATVELPLDPAQRKSHH
ncbi:hypothetical protein H0H81_009806 [Sphagnurus paluster]|uniref:Uncharacterized protein n=1 Tax=Sphagnurus paluster TaxID=117069 RepID=A0A9P7KIP5_9AGAR|nr:hypothetical protein H0H81_009806 [Sphagnurus paluster]